MKCPAPTPRSITLIRHLDWFYPALAWDEGQSRTLCAKNHCSSFPGGHTSKNATFLSGFRSSASVFKRCCLWVCDTSEKLVRSGTAHSSLPLSPRARKPARRELSARKRMALEAARCVPDKTEAWCLHWLGSFIPESFSCEYLMSKLIRNMIYFLILGYDIDE